MNRLERLMLVVGMTDRLSGPLNRIQSTVNRVTSQARKAFKNATAGVTALFAATINPANDMNKALSEVRSLEVAESTLARLNQAGLQYSIEFGESAQGYVRAAYDIQSAIDGLVGDDLPRFTTAGGTLAKATKANVGDITNYFGSMYGIFRNQANAMGKANWVEMLAGRTATAVQKFKTTGPEMAAAFGALGADATSYGVDMAEQMAILGNLQSTMSGSEAGTKYRSYLAGIANAESVLGLSFSDESGRLLPVVDVLNLIQSKFGSIEKLKDGKMLKNAFGGDNAVMFLAAMSQDIGKVNQDITDLSNVKGMEKAIWMAEQMKDPWSSFSSGITAVSIAIYQKVLPSIEPFIYWMISGLKTITEWTDKYPHLTKAVGMFGVGLLGLAVVGGTLTLAIGLMQFAMAGFIATSAGLKAVAAGFGLLTGGLWSAVAGTWAFTAALLANPFTWVVLAVIALIVVIGVLIYKYFQPLKAFLVGFWQGFVDGFSPVIESFSGLFGALKMVGGLLMQLWQSFKVVFTAISDLIAPLISKFITPIQSTNESLQSATNTGVAFGQLVGNALNLLFSPLKMLTQGLTGFVEFLGSVIKMAIAGVQWVIDKFNKIPGIDVDLNLGDVPEFDLPKIKQTVELNPVAPLVPRTETAELQPAVIKQLVELNPAANADFYKNSNEQQTNAEQQRAALNPPELSRSTQAHVDHGGLLQTYNQSQSTRNNSKTNHVEKLEIHNHGEPVRGDQLMYELEMMA